MCLNTYKQRYKCACAALFAAFAPDNFLYKTFVNKVQWSWNYKIVFVTVFVFCFLIKMQVFFSIFFIPIILPTIFYISPDVSEKVANSRRVWRVVPQVRRCWVALGKTVFPACESSQSFLFFFQRFQVEPLATLVVHAFTLLRSLCVFKKKKYHLKEYEGCQWP